ncbi:olfactory receptor 5AN6-like [Gastrophryne carolinensis]
MQSNVTLIILTGFPGLHGFKIMVFLVILVSYCLIISGNTLIILLVALNKNLHSPMYFFISQVSLCDILLTTDIIPNMFLVILKEGAAISFIGCVVQFFVFGSTEAAECLLLTIMSYDRYVAICNPFNYSTIVSPMFCIQSMTCTCLISVVGTMMVVFSMNNLHFCGANVIDHFFCDLTPLLEIACSDIAVIRKQLVILCVSVLICPLIIIVTSYICIFSTILGISSITGRKKAYSTCSSHLTVVCLFFGSLISIYMVPNRGHLGILNKMLSLFYTMMTPIFNPIIYSLRNAEFNKAFKKIKNLVEHKLLREPI